MVVRVGQVEDMTVEMTEKIITVMERQKTQKPTDLECRSRRNNIRIVGAAEGEEGNPMIRFVSDLLKRELPLPTDFQLKIQWAHRSPLIINFQEFTTEEMVLKEAWKRGKIQFG